jgi:ABC-type bacteriocin/lantibiotic exporter with double-glycine peptidase domain
MIETIKASGSEDIWFGRWGGFYASLNRTQTSFEKLNAVYGLIPQAVQQLSQIAILIFGAYLVMNGQFTAGMLLAFQTYIAQFLQPIGELIVSAQSIQEMRTNMERIEDVIKYKTDVPEENAEISEKDEDLDKIRGQIELRNITFGYSMTSKPLINDFSMTIRPGGKVAFVGTSGCGKSTLVSLISGLYEPWEGEILYGGKPRSEIPRPVFSSSIAVVDQSIVLFNDTISNNLKMLDNTIEDYEVIMAARDASIHEDIMRREGGYRLMLTENGRNLSGGQRQRLEIARILAQDPTIVIMDEATSALDAITEQKVTEAICSRGITCIIVAHRLSTIRDCDEIVVMHRGEIVERGMHDELMDKNGMYSELVTTE